MKAAFFETPGIPLQLRETNRPSPARDEIVIQVSHCGICSSDLSMTSGKGAYTAAQGSVLGHEIAGIVVELGADVIDLSKGDRVAVIPASGCGHCELCEEGEFHKCEGFAWHEGGYSEYIVSKPRYCFRLAEHLPVSDGALVEPMAVALRAIRHANLVDGQKILVLGAGPIGLSCVYWARHFNCEVATLASSDRRKALAKSIGASQFVIGKNKDAEALLNELGGAPDVVFECTGAPGMINLAVDLIKRHSTIVIPGWCTQPDTFLPMTAMHKELRLQFTALYNRDDFQYVVDTMAADKEASYRRMITGTIPLEKLPTTFEALRSPNDHVKVTVSPLAE